MLFLILLIHCGFEGVLIFNLVVHCHLDVAPLDLGELAAR